MLCGMETRNANADGTLIARGDADCTITAEWVDTDNGPMIRLNCTTPWDTWVGVDLTADEFRKVAQTMLEFIDQM